jgi:hypothetical protein
VLYIFEATVRILKTKDFARFARKARIGDDDLREAVDRADQGLIDADLGGGLIKQRIARFGQGRSRGFRTIIAWRSKQRSIFVYGFAKNRRDNISDADLTAFRDLAALLLGYDGAELKRAVVAGELLEVTG